MNNKTVITAIFVFLISLGFMAGNLLPKLNGQLQLVAEANAAEDATAERKVKYWAAPMDPTYIRNEPGKSPMGMDLIPVYEDSVQSGSTITIDPVTVQNMGVRTAPVVRGDIARSIRTVGVIAYEESRQYSVNSKIAGWVERLHVSKTGQTVKKGAALLEIYSPELVTAQEEFLLALSGYESARNSSVAILADSSKRLLDAARRRLQLWDISSRDISKLEQSRQVRKRMTLYAPYGGIVTMKMVNEGMFVKPGKALFEISDLSRVWVYADLYENELPFVKVGQTASVTLPYAGEEPRSAKITYIYPYVDAKTRTVKARFEFANLDMSLRPDMYVNVEIQTEPQSNVLSVPVQAVLNSGAKQTVFVALGEGKFEPRVVKTGVQGDAGMIEIRQGVAADERVVISAQFMLDSESRLREAISKMLEPETDSGDVEDLFGDEDSSSAKKLDDLF